MAGPYDDIDAIGQQYRAQLSAPLDTSSLPQLSVAPASPPSEAAQHSTLYNAARSGWNNLQAVSDQNVAAGLKLIGADQASADWSKSAAQQSQEAQRFVMPELQASPGESNFSWSNLPQQALYLGVQNAPFMLAAGLGGKALGRFIPEAAFEGTGAAAMAGRALGAMGEGAGTAAEGAAALRNAAATTAASYPMAVGSMYGEAVDRGDPTWSDAAKAAILGVPYAAGEAGEIATLGGIFKGAKAAHAVAAGDGLLETAKVVARAGATQLVNEGFTEGAQTILEQSFRSDLPLSERVHNVVNAMFLGAVGGAATGGAAAGAGRVMRQFNAVPAAEIAKDPGTMADAVDASGAGIDRTPPASSSSSPSPAGAPSAGLTTATPEAPVAPSAPVITDSSAVNPPVEPDFNPMRPYAHIGEEELTQRYQAAPDDSPQQAAIAQEVRARLQERVAEQAGTPAPTTTTEQQQQTQQFTTQLAKDAGLKGAQLKTAQAMNVGDIASAFDVVQARMQDALEKGKNPSKAVQQLNDYFGIFDAQGNQRSIADELAVMQDAKETARTAQQAKQIDTRIAQLETIQQRQAQVQDAKAQVEQAAQAQEAQRQADAQLAMARATTAQPLQSSAQQETAGLSAKAKQEFMAGLRDAVAEKEAPTRKNALAGYEFAQKYREAQNLVETANAQAANAPEQSAQTFGVNGAPVQGNAASPGAQQVSPAGAPVEGQNVSPAGAPVEGQNAVPAQGQGQQQSPAQGQVQQQSPAQQGQNAVPNERQITPAGEALLVKGGAPSSMTAQLKRVAQENGFTVTPDTKPADVVDHLRAMKAQPRAQAAAADTIWVRDGVETPAQRVGMPEQRDGRLVQQISTPGGKAMIPVEQLREPDGSPFVARVVPPSRPSTATQQAAVAPQSSPSTASSQTAPRSAPETVRAVGDGVREAVRELTAAEAAPPRAAPSAPPGGPPRSPTTPPSSPPSSPSGLLSKLKSSVSRAWLRVQLGWTTLHHLAEHFANEMPQLRQLVQALENRQNISHQWAAIGLQPINTFNTLKADVQASLGNLMARATELKLNPQRTWEEHRHILTDKTLTPERKAELQAEHRKLREMWDALRRNGDAKKTYEGMLAMNRADRFAHHAVALHRAMQLDPTIAPETRSALGDPMRDFLHNREVKSPAKLLEFWKEQSEAVMALAKSEIGRKDAGATKTPSVVEQLYKQFKEEEGAMYSYPYFHLGRGGEHFVSFELNKLADGTVERRALQEVERLVNGILPKEQQVKINPLTAQSRVYLRIDSEDLARQVATAVRARSLLVDKNSVKDGPRGSGAVSGPAQNLMNQMLNELKVSHAFEGTDEEVKAAKEQMAEFIRQFSLDVMPDIAIEKSLAPRENIPGYRADMIRSYASRLQQGGQSLARMAGSAQVLDTLKSMHVSAQEAKDGKGGDPYLLNALYHEAAKREYLRAISDHNSMIETLKALNHSYFLGFNPSHALLQQISIPVLLLPELAKRNGVGFMRASRSIASATNDSFAIMGALMQTANNGSDLKQKLKNLPSLKLTPEVLDKALPGKANEAKREFLMRVIYSGGIESGSESRELGRIVEGKGGTLDLYTRYASAMGFYSETSTRLIAALSSYEVNKGKGEDAQFHDALHTISESMFNFSNYNVARQMGRNGFMGPATPLVTAFMSYNAQLTEKLYRETYKAIKGNTAEEAAEARKFLLMHAVAVTAISGMMGLPFATVAASAVDRLKDWADPEDGPFDSRAWFRNWLGTVFGETAGDVLARGLPRLAGADISQRAGEASLIPGSEFLADRGSWRDAFGRMEQRGFGSPAAAVSNILDGVDKMNTGDYLSASRQLMPQGIKNMFDSYTMGENGYVDAKGHKLPLSVGAEDQLRKLIGFKGARESDYGEVKQIMEREKTRLKQEGGPIMKHLVEALQKGDRDAARTYLTQAQEFDAQHPDSMILPKLQARLGAAAKAQGIESATGMPAGVQLQNQHLMDSLKWYQGRER